MPTVDFAVLGAGLAGLTFALEAARRGRSVCVLESADHVGGLARTVGRNGYYFDLGGHRFHTKDSAVERWVRELIPHGFLQVPRRSRILLDGQFVDYPLRFPNAALALGPARLVRILGSYLYAVWCRNGGADVSLEDWVVRRFGRALFEVYFKPYTEKVWGLACSEVSADWASQRIRVPSLASAARASLSHRLKPAGTMLSRFLYPASGFGAIPESMARAALATGKATIHLHRTVCGLRFCAATREWEVTSESANGDAGVRARAVVSTIPIGALARALCGPSPVPPELRHLGYRGLICIFVAIDQPQVSEDTWTYLPDPKLSIGRTHEPRNWSPRLAPDGRTSLCLEAFCTEGDSRWRQPDGALIDRALGELELLGLVRRERVTDAWLLRLPHAYPVSRVGGAAHLRGFQQWVSQWPNLHLLGRTGAFEYLNADAAIQQAMERATLCAQSPP